MIRREATDSALISRPSAQLSRIRTSNNWIRRAIEALVAALEQLLRQTRTSANARLAVMQMKITVRKCMWRFLGLARDVQISLITNWDSR